MKKAPEGAFFMEIARCEGQNLGQLCRSIPLGFMQKE